MKAIGLLSGGIDSQLAIKLMLEQGIEITAVHFSTIFCTCTPKGCTQSAAKKAAESLNIDFIELNNNKEFLEVVKNPKHGYGSRMNPCIDCRILMFKRVKKYMDELGANFIVTGEVAGQRPMSQRKAIMELIDKESGLQGFILRPLSAGRLHTTIPEEKGWVDRAKLLAHSGRSRRLQISLAEKYNIKDYPCPAGGCLLTDPEFAKRIKECFEYGESTLNDMQLLKIGRHFRLLNKMKLVVGRNENENNKLQNIAQKTDILIEPVNVPGPLALLRDGSCDNMEEYLKLAFGVCAGYCDRNRDIVIRYGRKDGMEVVWDKEVIIKPPRSSECVNDYCRRI